MKKAIVVSEKGAYKHLNGHTLEVNESHFVEDLAANRVVLNIPNGTYVAHVDFQFKNILFVDASNVAQALYGDAAINGMKRWAKIHGVNLAV